MIDWAYVATNSLWILDLSIILAAFSYHDWLAHETGQRRRHLFERPAWRLSFSTGMVLFCLGLGLGRRLDWWERLFWGTLVFAFVWQLFRQLRSRRRTRQSA